MFFSAAVCSCFSIDEDGDSDCRCSGRVVEDEGSGSGMDRRRFLEANGEVAMPGHILTQL